MRPPHLRPAAVAAATMLLLPAAVHALAAQELRAEPDAAADAWISVDSTGLPSTVTPVRTVADGVPTTLSAAPVALTATVRTRTAYGELTTSTGTTPAGPTADNKKGQGAFLACQNAEGAFAPFCEPAGNSSLYPGTTYYVTWDASALNASRVSVTGTYLNSTTGEAGDEVFTSDEIKARWSYYAWTPNSGYLKHGTGAAVNITLTLNALSSDSDDITHTYTGPTVLVTKTPTYHQPAPTLPSGAALYIALPVVFGFCLLMIFGVCLWNRKTRTIGLGNVMSRSRHGYGAAKSRAKRMTTRIKGGRKAKKQAAALQNIRMMENLPEDQIYRDHPAQFDEGKEYQYDKDADELNVDGGERAHGRSDSDGLGSLAGTPTSRHFPRHQTGGPGGNVFREEMERQQRDR